MAVQGRTRSRRLFDICANLTNSVFDDDRDVVIAHARERGVAAMFVPGSDLEDSASAIAIAQAHPDMFSSVGVHPWAAEKWTAASADDMYALLRSPTVVAVGECGLDYCGGCHVSPDVQKKCFEGQLLIAKATQLPLFLHERDAHDDFVEILGRHAQELPRGLVHCFTGSSAELQVYVDMGFYVGITGWLTQKRGAGLREVIKDIPLSRLVIETDAPFLLPKSKETKKLKRNEPSLLPIVLQEIAACLSISEDELSEITWQNAVTFLGIDADNSGEV